MTSAVHGQQVDIGAAAWKLGEYVGTFASRNLRPVEVLLLARYREVLSGRVLELGCGGGRVLGYLASLDAEVVGIDISPAMVEHCRHNYPSATVRVGDLRTLSQVVEGSFDAVLGTYNVIDVLDDAERRRVLSELREWLNPGGLLIFSSHNLAHVDNGRPSADSLFDHARRKLSKLDRPPHALFGAAARLPKRIRNRRRLAPLERRHSDHAILNDEALDYGLLHYYIGRDDQARQLDEVGFELIECLDLEGRTVPAGGAGYGPELHYVARAKADV